MVLGDSFVFSASLIILMLLPLYIYRKRVFKHYYENKDIRQFEKELLIYIRQHHPKIPFQFTIFKTIRTEKDSRVKQALIVENLSNQFIDYYYDIGTQKTVNPKYLWTTYEQDAVTKDGKAPKDLPRRKEIAWKRDEHKCLRCGEQLKINDSYIHYVKPIEEKGTYHLENIAILCMDCKRVCANPPLAQIKDLIFYSNLMKKAIY